MPKSCKRIVVLILILFNYEGTIISVCKYSQLNMFNSRNKNMCFIPRQTKMFDPGELGVIESIRARVITFSLGY